MKFHSQSWEGLQELIEAFTGCDMKAILSDEEKPVTFTEISMRRQAAEYQFRKTGDMKYAKIAARCEGALKAMLEKAQTEGKYLHLRPSELDQMLNPRPTNPSSQL